MARDSGQGDYEDMGDVLVGYPGGSYLGITPTIGLADLKFPPNVGAAIRAASCYGMERMRGYKDIGLRKDERFRSRPALSLTASRTRLVSRRYRR